MFLQWCSKIQNKSTYLCHHYCWNIYFSVLAWMGQIEFDETIFLQLYAFPSINPHLLPSESIYRHDWTCFQRKLEMRDSAWMIGTAIYNFPVMSNQENTNTHLYAHVHIHTYACAQTHIHGAVNFYVSMHLSKMTCIDNINLDQGVNLF